MMADRIPNRIQVNFFPARKQNYALLSTKEPLVQNHCISKCSAPVLWICCVLHASVFGHHPRQNFGILRPGNNEEHVCVNANLVTILCMRIKHRDKGIAVGRLKGINYNEEKGLDSVCHTCRTHLRLCLYWSGTARLSLKTCTCTVRCMYINACNYGYIELQLFILSLYRMTS